MPAVEFKSRHDARRERAMKSLQYTFLNRR